MAMMFRVERCFARTSLYSHDGLARTPTRYIPCIPAHLWGREDQGAHFRTGLLSQSLDGPGPKDLANLACWRPYGFSKDLSGPRVKTEKEITPVSV
jgi:hypothetical protein